jgi:hypothetical protein
MAVGYANYIYGGGNSTKFAYSFEGICNKFQDPTFSVAPTSEYRKTVMLALFII